MTHKKKRAHLGSWLPAGSYPTFPALLQCCLLLLTSPGSNITAFAESTHLEAPCALPKLSISPPRDGNTQLIPTSLVTFGNTLYFLLSFLFS